jgi:hypothetical protein
MSFSFSGMRALLPWYGLIPQLPNNLPCRLNIIEGYGMCYSLIIARRRPSFCLYEFYEPILKVMVGYAHFSILPGMSINPDPLSPYSGAHLFA